MGRGRTPCAAGGDFIFLFVSFKTQDIPAQTVFPFLRLFLLSTFSCLFNLGSPFREGILVTRSLELSLSRLNRDY
jgi:hypothetical protein